MGKIKPERHYKSFWAQNSHITGVAGGYWRKDILLKMGLTWETHARIFGNLSIFFFRTTFEGCQDFLRFHSKDKDFTHNKCNRQWTESITTKGRYHISIQHKKKSMLFTSGSISKRAMRSLPIIDWSWT